MKKINLKSKFQKINYTNNFGELIIHSLDEIPQKRERVFIVSVREDVLDDIGLPFMCLDSSIFPDPKEERYIKPNFSYI